MAERRMFSKKIVDSARFIKMPVSSQALYFHMGVRADDDGVVEGYNVMRMIGATEDDLKVLVAKGFVTILNEDLVAYINDWKEHNLIRADRKVDSIYKNLLLQIVPEVQLLEPKQRSDVKKKQSKEFSGQPMDVQWTTNGQPMDSEMSAQDRIGKDRLDKDNIGKDSIASVEASPTTELTTPTKQKEVKHKYGEYLHVLLTDKQYTSLIEKYGQTIIDGYIQKIDEWIQLKGKSPYKDFNLAIQNWLKKDKVQPMITNSYQNQDNGGWW